MANKPFKNLKQKAPKKELTLEEKALILHKQAVAELAKKEGAIIIGIEEREKEVRTRTNKGEEPAEYETTTVMKPITFGTIGGKEYPVNVIVQAMNREGRKCSIAISDEVMNDPRLNLDLKNFLVAL